MPRRKSSVSRCSVCGLHLPQCLCAALPVRPWPSDFVVVQHNRERHKPTSTGRVTAAVLGAPVLNYGAQDEAMVTTPLDRPDTDYFVLYPLPDAAEVTPDHAVAAPGRRRCFVILDGTWHQCSRMARRAPRVAEFPSLVLPPGPPSRWGVRKPPNPAAVCTFEAATRLVAALYGLPAAAPLAEFFAELSRRMCDLRGRAPVGEPPQPEP